jgi:hypothetical protein
MAWRELGKRNSYLILSPLKVIIHDKFNRFIISYCLYSCFYVDTYIRISGNSMLLTVKGGRWCERGDNKEVSGITNFNYFWAYLLSCQYYSLISYYMGSLFILTYLELAISIYIFYVRSNFFYLKNY